MLDSFEVDTYALRNEAEYWRVRTVSGDSYTGSYDGTNSSNEYRWLYFVNESENYRITITSPSDASGVYCSVNKTDGSHESLTGDRREMFERVEAIEAVT